MTLFLAKYNTLTSHNCCSSYRRPTQVKFCNIKKKINLQYPFMYLHFITRGFIRSCIKLDRRVNKLLKSAAINLLYKQDKWINTVPLETILSLVKGEFGQCSHLRQRFHGDNKCKNVAYLILECLFLQSLFKQIAEFPPLVLKHTHGLTGTSWV